MVMPALIGWPVLARPVVRLSGLFPLQASGFSYVYRSRTTAVHLHEYAGTIRHMRAGEFVDYRLEPGTLTISPAGQDSSYDLPRPGTHWCVHFELASGGEAGLPEVEMPVVEVPVVRHLGGLQSEAAGRMAHVARLHRLEGRFPGEKVKFAAAAGVALQEFLVWVGMLERVNSAGPAAFAESAVERLRQMIDRNLDRRLSAAELANHAGLSQNYLARLFKTAVGVSIPHYVLSRRVAVARVMLETTNLTIKEVAVRVGIANAQHFNKQFRALTGVSPSAFRTRR